MATRKDDENAKEVVEVESKYSEQELMSNAQTVFGQMPEVVAGALHGDDREELTITETKSLIEKFLKKKVNK